MVSQQRNGPERSHQGMSSAKADYPLAFLYILFKQMKIYARNSLEFYLLEDSWKN